LKGDLSLLKLVMLPVLKIPITVLRLKIYMNQEDLISRHQTFWWFHVYGSIKLHALSLVEIGLLYFG